MANCGGVEMTRRAQAGVVVLDIEPGVHARLVVVRRDQAGEHLARLRFDILGEAGLCARRRCIAGMGAGAVALDEQARASAK